MRVKEEILKEYEETLKEPVPSKSQAKKKLAKLHNLERELEDILSPKNKDDSCNDTNSN